MQKRAHSTALCTQSRQLDVLCIIWYYQQKQTVHVLEWSCRTTAQLDQNKWAEGWGVSPGPAEDADARTLTTETPITIWTVTNTAVGGIGALPYGNNPPQNLFIFNKWSVIVCATSALAVQWWENVHSSSPRLTQHRKEKHDFASIGGALCWCRKQIEPVFYSWNSCFGLQLLC